MTAPHDEHVTTQPHGAELPYSEHDIQGFHQEDIHAAKMIVGLMTSIFTVGIVLYVMVALTVHAVV